MTTRTSIGPTTGCPGRESERHDSAVAVESPQGSSVPASLGNLRDGRECLRSRGIAARHPGCLIILLTQRRMITITTRQQPNPSQRRVSILFGIAMWIVSAFKIRDCARKGFCKNDTRAAIAVPKSYKPHESAQSQRLQPSVQAARAERRPRLASGIP